MFKSRLLRLFPFLRWAPLVTRDTLKSDAVAGLTGAIIVLPQGVAFAMIAGLPPIYGLYTAMLPPIIAALFGSSRHLISGPTTAISIVVFATVSQHASPGSAEYLSMVLALTLFAGVFQLALGLGRMGALVNFVSHSVVVGFTTGAAILIATSEVKHYLGITLPAGETFLHTWQDIFANLDGVNWRVSAVATLTLASGILFAKYRPRWPALLIAMTLGSLLAAVLGGEPAGIALVGELPRSLPPFLIPDITLGTVKELGSGALAVAMLGLVEAVSIGRSVALKSGQRIDGNQEFIGQGLSNIVGSLFSCYASSGSFTRSGINYTAGARTPMAAIAAALFLVLIVLAIAPLVAYLPIAAMAGVLFIVAYRLIDFHHFAKIIRSSKSETAVLLTTFLSTLFVELEFAIYVGVMLSLVIYLKRTARPRVLTWTPDPKHPERVMVVGPGLKRCPQLCIARIDGSLFFGAVDHVQRAFRYLSEKNPRQKHLLLIGSGINFIDLAGAELLVQEARRRRDQGGEFYIVNVKEGACQILKKSGYIEEFCAENIFASKTQAIAAIYKRLDADYCAQCEIRVFHECRQSDSI